MACFLASWGLVPSYTVICRSVCCDNLASCSLFHNVMKRNLYSISKKIAIFFYETDYRIRFKMLWNGICIPFKKKLQFFYEIFFYETDYRIRFKMLWNGICIPFPIHFDFFCETAFVFRLVKVWNAFHNPFHKRFRYIVYETENKFRFASQANRKNLSWYEG